jgi:predicted transcriptional regulator
MVVDASDINHDANIPNGGRPELAEGRCTPSFLEHRTDYRRQAIQGRLTVLRASEHVVKVDTGLYEITDKGRDALDD